MGCERGNGTANDEIGKCELERWTGGWKPSEDRRGILCRERAVPVFAGFWEQRWLKCDVLAVFGERCYHFRAKRDTAVAKRWQAHVNGIHISGYSPSPTTSTSA